LGLDGRSWTVGVWLAGNTSMLASVPAALCRLAEKRSGVQVPAASVMISGAPLAAVPAM